MYFDKTIQKCVRGSMKQIRLARKHKPAKVPETSKETVESLLAVRLPMDSSTEEDQNKNQEIIQDKDHGKEVNAENILPPPEPPAHLNGSLKLTVGAENIDEVDDATTKIDGNTSSGDKKEPHSLWKWPAGQGKFTQATWILTWPVHLVFAFTIPDCEKPRFKKWFPLTFIMCIVWIGSLSYVVAWMITIIGDTLKIPDSVMGITFLAAGTSVPEAVSSVIVSKQGHGSMGISNSIGSNTFDILLCLGLPWFIKATFMPTIAGKHWVGINSAGIEYSAISLLSTLLMLYVAFALNKFQLDKRVGRVCLLMYAVFLILASLIELNAFFRVNLPTCGRS